MDTLSGLRSLLDRLDGEPAEALESETLECKGWDPAPGRLKAQVRELRETVVCLANQRGGTILLGVADRKRSRRAAIVGVGNLDSEVLRREIHRGTEPSILVDIQAWDEPEGRIFAIRVPRGMPPHTTTEGVGKIRVGKECRPLVGSELARLLVASRELDLSGQPVEGATLSHLDPAQIEELRRMLARDGQKPDLARLAQDEMLANLGLVREDSISLAAILLLGTSVGIARFAPQHEVTVVRYRTRTRYDLRHDLKGPLLELLNGVQRILEAHVRLTSVAEKGFGELFAPDITWLAAREAVLNALVHRDWFVNQSVLVELHPDHFQVASPGGFVGGVTPENILRHAPVRRNPLLAEVFQAIGYVNRAGLGVDRLYEELLSWGKGIPLYEADEAGVRLKLPTRTNEGFARFVAEETRAGRRLELDDLVVLWTATERGQVDRWSAARDLQLREDVAAERLVSLRSKSLLVARGRGRGTSYQLGTQLSDLLRGRVRTDLDLPLANEAVRLRVQTVLAERGSLTNTEVRRVTGLSRAEVVRLMRSLRDEELARLDGRGRGARWVPGPKLQATRRKRRRRE